MSSKNGLGKRIGERGAELGVDSGVIELVGGVADRVDDFGDRLTKVEARQQRDRRWAEERLRRLSLKVQQIWSRLKNRPRRGK